MIPAEVAKSYGLSGPNVRGSGVDWDLRRDSCPPGLVYDKIDWKVWTHPDCDAFARSWIRLQETREATSIVDQLLDSHPDRPDHGQGARASSRCPRARPGWPPRTRSARWATTS